MSAVYGVLCCFDPGDEFSEPCYRRCITSVGTACGCLGYAESAKGHKYAQFGSTRKHNDEEVLRGLADDDDDERDDDDLVEAANLLGTSAISDQPGGETDRRGAEGRQSMDRRASDRRDSGSSRTAMDRRPSGGQFPSKGRLSYAAMDSDKNRHRASTDTSSATGYTPVSPQPSEDDGYLKIGSDAVVSPNLVDMSPDMPNDYLQIGGDTQSVSPRGASTTEYLQIGSPDSASDDRESQTAPRPSLLDLDDDGTSHATPGQLGTADMLLLDNDGVVSDAILTQMEGAVDAQIDSREDDLLASFDETIDAREASIEAELDAIIDAREDELGSGHDSS